MRFAAGTPSPTPAYVCGRGDEHRAMKRIRQAFIAIYVLTALVLAAQPASAVILSRTSSRNIYAPGGTNYNSGWQWEGNWGGGFLGTPIAPQYFITAEH